MLRHGLARIQPDTQVSPSNKATALGQWGVTIKKDPIEVVARELQPPTVIFKRCAPPALRLLLGVLVLIEAAGTSRRAKGFGT